MLESMSPGEFKSLRTDASMSQADLAQAIGMSRETVGQMERGTAPIERRTALAVRYVTQGPGRPKRTAADILHDVAETLDRAVVRGNANDDQMRRLERLEAEWKEARGAGIAGPLFLTTRGTLGMLRSATAGDPTQAPQQAELVRIKQQWRELALAARTG